MPEDEVRRSKWNFASLNLRDFNSISVQGTQQEPVFVVKDTPTRKLQDVWKGPTGKISSYGISEDVPLFVVKANEGIEEEESEPLKVLRRAKKYDECDIVPLKRLHLGSSTFYIMPLLKPIVRHSMSIKSAFSVYKDIRDQIDCLADNKMYYYDLKTENTMKGDDNKAYLTNLSVISGPGSFPVTQTFVPSYIINAYVQEKGEKVYKLKQNEHRYNLRVLGIIYFFTLLDITTLKRPYKYWGNWEDNNISSDARKEFERINLTDGEYPIFYTLYTHTFEAIFNESPPFPEDFQNLTTPTYLSTLIQAAVDDATIREELMKDLNKFKCPYKPTMKPLMRVFMLEETMELLNNEPLLQHAPSSKFKKGTKHYIDPIQIMVYIFILGGVLTGTKIITGAISSAIRENSNKKPRKVRSKRRT